MPTKKELPILIVGAGIGGMAVALALAKVKIKTILFEQASEFRIAGAGLQFCPNTLKVIDYLGMYKDFEKIAIFPDNLCYVDGLTGFKFLNLPLGDKFVERFRYPFASFKREDVLRVFLENCKQSPLIKLVTSARVVEVKDLEDRVVVNTEQKDSFEGDAVIGCDGLWSIVRNFILGNEDPASSGQIIYRGVVKSEDMPKNLQLNDITHYVRPNAHIVYYPIGNRGYFNISAIYQTNRVVDPRETAANPEELQYWFKDSIPVVMELLSLVDKTRMWSLNDRTPISSWSRGRMALLGDAAHPTLPYLTSGAGMAVEDAITLAHKISEYRGDYPKIFSEYQKERYIRTAYVQLFSRAYGNVHHSKGVARELRNSLISKRSVEENYDWISYLYSGIDLPNKTVS